MPLKIWEIVSVGSSKNPDVHYEAWLYEQPVLAYLLGRLTFWLWMRCPRRVTDHHGDLGLRFELAMTWDIPRWRRRDVEFARIRARDPDNWDRPLEAP